MSYVGDLRLILRGRNFRRLFATRLFSQTSDGVFQFAVMGFALFSPEGHTDPAAAAKAFAVLLLPYSLLGPFVGVFIDRWSRRQILVVAPIIRAACIAGAAAVLATSGATNAFYLAALAALGVNRFFLAALGASLPHVVPRDRLIMANAITPTAGTIMTAVGMGVGYLLRRFLLGEDAAGIAMLLVISGVLFGLTSLIATTMARDLLGPTYDPAQPRTREALRSVVAGLIDGARHLRDRPTVAGALFSMALSRLVFGLLTMTTAVLYANHFHRGDAVAGLDDFAIAAAATGVGLFLSAPITPWATERMQLRTWVIVLLVTGAVTTAVLFPIFHQISIVIAAFILGLVSQGVKISADVVVQRDLEDAYLGRMFSIYDLLFNGLTVAGATLAAVMLPDDGRSYAAVAVAAVGYLIGAVIYRRLSVTQPAPPQPSPWSPSSGPPRA